MSSFLTNGLFFLLHLLGLVIICAYLFLYEDEEGKVQNKIEEWWIKLSDKQTASRSKVAAFMQEVARLTGSGFDRLFGRSPCLRAHHRRKHFEYPEHAGSCGEIGKQEGSDQGPARRSRQGEALKGIQCHIPSIWVCNTWGSLPRNPAFCQPFSGFGLAHRPIPFDPWATGTDKPGGGG